MKDDLNKKAEELFKYEKGILDKALEICNEQNNMKCEWYENYKNLTFHYKKLLRQSIKLLKISDSQQNNLKEVQNNINSLLDNAKQGFLTFGKDFLVNKEYSRECLKIFSHRVENKQITELLFTYDEDKQSFFKKIFSKIFSEGEELSVKEDVLISLLPKKLYINNKHITIEYKIIRETSENENKDIKIMLILTDITESKRLEKQIQNERDTLKMIVKAVMNRNELISNINEYEYFAKHHWLHLLSKDINVKDLIDEIFLKIHTFKGNFSQLHMLKIAQYLHDFETELATLNKVEISAKSIRSYLDKIDLWSWIEEEKKRIEEFLGEDFLQKDTTVSVGINQIIQIEERIIKILSKEQIEQLLPDVKKLRVVPLEKRIEFYSDYIMILAKKMNKLVKPIHMTAEDILVDDKKYDGFIKSLVNIFRNILDHGIESIEERLEKSKPEYGNIYCRIKRDKQDIIISIKDDGRGIDFDMLMDRLTCLNIYSEEKLLSLKQEELLECIFIKGFSTKKNVSLISGRGMGLYAVKVEVEKLGGQIKMISKKDHGVEFNIKLPILL